MIHAENEFSQPFESHVENCSVGHPLHSSASPIELRLQVHKQLHKRTKTNLYLSQYLSHKLGRALNFVLLILADLITLNMFGLSVFLMKIELIVFVFGTGFFG